MSEPLLEKLELELSKELELPNPELPKLDPGQLELPKLEPVPLDSELPMPEPGLMKPVPVMSEPMPGKPVPPKPEPVPAMPWLPGRLISLKESYRLLNEGLLNVLVHEWDG